MQVFDNFLPEHMVQQAFLSEDFPWFYNPNKLISNVFLYAYVQPFEDILNPLRIKANLTFKMDDNYEGGWHHYEAAIQDHNTAIFYVTKWSYIVWETRISTVVHMLCERKSGN